MSIIAEKVGIREEHVKMLVNYGVISTTWLIRDQIVIHYKKQLQICNKTEAVHRTADEFRKNPSDIYAILREDIFK